MAYLRIIDGPGLGTVYPLRGGHIVLGREAACGVRVDDSQVSRTHAEIRREDETTFSIRDMGSSNGTDVNGTMIEDWTPLAEGDQILLGRAILQFSFKDANPAGADEIPEPETIIHTIDTQTLPLLQGGDEDTGEQVNALRFLLDLARAAEEADNAETLAGALADGISGAIESDRVFLFIGKDENLEPVARDLPKHLKATYKKPYSQSVVQQAARERVSVLSTLAEDERFKDARSIVKARLTSAICVPLLVGEDLLGALYLDRLEEAEPFSEADLELATAAGVQCSMALLNIRRLEELRISRDTLEAELTGPAGFVGESPALRPVYDFIQRAAPTDAGVLILGESGTGKELVARAIHKASPRVDRPFVIVNCAALAESLAEAELFGHERGAFTGAEKSRPGRFLAADGGTIFLDEIGELSEPIQAKLLRVLEEGEIAPVGEAGVRHIDVRVVAATNRDLAKEVEAGRFRQDLYYRLNILCINLPPLRQRTGDAKRLLEHFVHFFGARCGRPNLQIDPAVLERVAQYSWPGNVRELRNAVERMVILAQGDTIVPADLPPEVGGGGALAPVPGGGGIAGGLRPLVDVERDHIIAVLDLVEGNKKKAAEVLAIDRSTLYAKLKQYGVG